ncbi:hypothetical protein C5167_000688 [Papaver somniferum]|uniref:Uncharacterized protein n=1 Tax=Papaver somniferum TaxID=3469 RepID=A0A4Y7KT99_PAPSO|nr:hypothetical protein C5167_000688 [Papaver somniferum]
MQVFLEDKIDASKWFKTVKNCQILLEANEQLPGQDGVFQFIIGDETYVIRTSPEEFSVTFGIPIPCIEDEGGIEDALLEPKSMTDYRLGRFYTKHKFIPPSRKDNDIRNPELKTKILELVKSKAHNQDLVTMMEFFLLSTVFVTTGDGGSINTKYIGFLESEDRVSWPHLIHKHIVESLKRESTEGCHLFLLVWLVEHSQLAPKCKMEYLRHLQKNGKGCF